LSFLLQTKITYIEIFCNSWSDSNKKAELNEKYRGVEHISWDLQYVAMANPNIPISKLRCLSSRKFKKLPETCSSFLEKLR